MRKAILASCIALALAGCDQDLAATLYLRDVQDLLSSAEHERLPTDVTIEVRETGLAKQCEKPEGSQMVEAVASVFEKASLISCESVSGSMNDRMIIKASTYIEHAGNEGRAGDYLVYFTVHNNDEGYGTVTVGFNRDKYEVLQKRIQSIFMMVRPSLDNAAISVTVNNDQRRDVHFVTTGGVFADGLPIDGPLELTLAPRQEVRLKLGDVKSSFLSKNGFTVVGAVAPSER